MLIEFKLRVTPCKTKKKVTQSFTEVTQGFTEGRDSEYGMGFVLLIIEYPPSPNNIMATEGKGEYQKKHYFCRGLITNFTDTK
jgi:hypothetical protein